MSEQQQQSRSLVNVNDSRILRSTQHINHADDVASSIAALYANEQLTDVTFLVQGVRFPAHRVILAARSDYFRALLYGGLSESSRSVINLNDISAVAFRHVLQYAYTGRLKVRKIRVLLDVLGLAHQYGFQSLERALSIHLTHSLLPSNVWLIYNLAVLYNLDELINACLQFLDAIAPAPLHSPQFLTLSQTAVERLLSRDSFCATEIEIFRSICAWFRARNEPLTKTPEKVMHDPEGEDEGDVKGDSVDRKNSKREPSPVVWADDVSTEPDDQRRQMMRICVRFELMSLTDLLTEVRSSKLVSSDDLLDAIGRQTKALPDLPHRGWLLPETNLATARFACALVSGEEGIYPHFFVDDDDGGGDQCNSGNVQQEFRINLTNPNAASSGAMAAESSEETDDELSDKESYSGSLLESSSVADIACAPAVLDQTAGPSSSVEGLSLAEPTCSKRKESSATRTTSLHSQHSIRASGQWSNVITTALARPTAPITGHQHSSFRNQFPVNSRLNQPSAVGRVQSVVTTAPVARTSHTPTDQSPYLLPATGDAPTAAMRSMSIPPWLQPLRSRLQHHPTPAIPPPPHSEYDVVRHSLDDPDAHIVIRLGKPSIVNTIRMQLWDRETRCYSYYVEVSLDQSTWSRVVDYRNHLCRSWQTLHFPTRVIRYIRVTGTRNTSNRMFHLVTFRCLYTEHVCKQLNGFLIPSYNVASVDHGATVLEGVSRNRNALIDGDARLYDWNSGYTCHQLGNGSIVVQLAQPYLIRSMRFLLWDLDDRFYSYSVHVSTNREDWRLVHDATHDRCQSWQVLTFPLQLVTFIRVVGSYNTANEVFHMVHLECPYPPAETFQSDNDAPSPKFTADMASVLPDSVNAAQPDAPRFEIDLVDVRPSSAHSSAHGSYSADLLNSSGTVEVADESLHTNDSDPVNRRCPRPITAAWGEALAESITPTTSPTSTPFVDVCPVTARRQLPTTQHDSMLDDTRWNPSFEQQFLAPGLRQSSNTISQHLLQQPPFSRSSATVSAVEEASRYPRLSSSTS